MFHKITNAKLQREKNEKAIVARPTTIIFLFGYKKRGEKNKQAKGACAIYKNECT